MQECDVDSVGLHVALLATGDGNKAEPRKLVGVVDPLTVRLDRLQGFCEEGISNLPAEGQLF